MKRLGLPSTKKLAALHESWKPQMSQTQVDREAVLEAINHRYNISSEEVDEVESLLRTIKSLPAYIEHPVFDKLCEVDY
jgi:DNA-directed RNA polymerase sigma subunit (sigma70/sigma32)